MGTCMKGTVFPHRVLQVNLDNINRLPHHIPRQKKSGNVPVRESNPLKGLQLDAFSP